MGKLSPKHNGSQRLLDIFYIPVTVWSTVYLVQQIFLSIHNIQAPF